MIIPFFLMHGGCPHRCLFCNERLTAGDGSGRIPPEAFAAALRAGLDSPRRKGEPVEVAFYGGTFTGLPREEQGRLLALAAPFLKAGAVSGIRLSTRPDGIDPEELPRLRRAGVTTVEIGAQSLDDAVLRTVRRGHDAAAVGRAVGWLRREGFRVGLHLMAGLPGDTPSRFAATVERTVALGPDTVRLHPTLVLRDTPLAEAFRRGAYRSLSLEEAVDLCGQALTRLTAAGIPVIRLGLQGTRELEAPGAILAGPYHPAFRSLVEGTLLADRAARLWRSPGVCEALDGNGIPPGPPLSFGVSPADLTAFLGPGRSNLHRLQQHLGLEALTASADPALPRGALSLSVRGRRFLSDPR